MITQEYNKQYVTIRNRLRKLKAKFIIAGLNEMTIAMIDHLNRLATDLDMKYSDEKPLDDVEIHLNAFESQPV
jgi:hypothetical protein